MKTFKKIASAVALLAGLGVAQQAPAAVQMTLTDGTTTIILDDNVGLDVNPLVGALTFVGTIGCFALNVSTAVGDAQTVGFTGLDLNSINSANCAMADTLTISFSETGYVAGGVFQGAIGGTLSGLDIFAEMFAGLNAFYDESNLIGSYTQTNDGAFAASFSNSVAGLPNPYSLTLVVELSGVAGLASFDFEGKVPEPATIGLLGLSLAGLGVATRRRRK
jgi:hypothetical protein